MKAVRFFEYGGPEVLELVEVDEPHPGPRQVRIAVHAAGVNGIDWKLRSGAMQQMMPVDLPSGTGLDAAGVVDEVGDQVDGVQVGDRVLGSGTATFAEHAVLDDWARMPEAMSFEEAAGYGVAVETAARILDLVRIHAGEMLLVSGASGGVGSAVIQLARLRGARVIGTASAANHDYLTGLGAVPLEYGDRLVARVRAVTPGGVDAALDLAGSGVIPELVELTGNPARVVSIADFTAPAHGAQVSGEPANRAAALREAVQLFADGTFHLPVAARYPLDEAAQAHRDSESGHVAGRRVVTIDR